MRKSIAVIGIGRFGFSLVKTLSTLKADVLTIDKSEEVLKKAADYATKEAICDATKIEALKDLGLSNFNTAVVAIGNDIHATILTTINLVELGVPDIIVRVDQDEYIPVMTKLGASRVIVPEESSAVSFAHQLVSSNFIDYYDIQGDYGIVKMNVPKDFIAKPLVEYDARNVYEVNIVGIIRIGKFFIPRGTDEILPNDTLLAIGRHENLNKFSASLSEK